MGSRNSGGMFVGALVAAFSVTTILIELIHRKSRVKIARPLGLRSPASSRWSNPDQRLYDKVDLDQDCVLNGELAFNATGAADRWAPFVLAHRR